MRIPFLFALLLLVTGCGGAPPPAPAVRHRGGSLAALRGTSPPASVAPEAAAAPPAHSDFPREFAITRGFKLGSPQMMTPTADGKAVVFLRAGAHDPRQSLFETDVATGKTQELLSPDAVGKGPETLTQAERARRERLRISTSGFTSFEMSADGSRIVVTLSGRLFLLTRGQQPGPVRELPIGAGAAIDPHLSADGKRLAYVRGNDLYFLAIDGGHEAAVTRGGTDTKTHGVAEFIAQEELDRSRGFWWAPDGKDLLYEEADTSKVEELKIADPAHPERDPERSAYPRAGKANAVIRLGLTNAQGGATRWVKWDNAAFPYVASVRWEKGALPTIYLLDRLQRHGLLLKIDPRDGTTTTLLEERDEAWLNVDPSVPRWLPDGSAFFWSSERSGGWELELHDASGKLSSTTAKKGAGYRELLAFDPARKVAYVTASSEPTGAAVFSVPFAGGEPNVIAYVDGGGVITAHFGHSETIFAAMEGARDGLRLFSVRSVDGKLHVELPSVSQAPPFLPNLELLKAGPDEIRVAIVRPHSFVSGKKYPIIDAAYGGPGYNVVVADAFAFLRAQWIADETGAIVVAIDARGTKWRGREWERAIAGKLGEVPLQGHAEAIAAIAARFPEVDASRAGIYGWSFGGYLAAFAILNRPDVFKAAVAGAPPTDWRDYDTCYTERYLGLPEDNEVAYRKASLLFPDPAKPARPLLLVHGTADDNVYFANSIKLADALEKAGRPFEFMPLASATHQVAQPELAEPAWRRIAEFLRVQLHAH
jgi:dipeptidyl-peptidase-4